MREMSDIEKLEAIAEFHEENEPLVLNELDAVGVKYTHCWGGAGNEHILVVNFPDKKTFEYAKYVMEFECPTEVAGMIGLKNENALAFMFDMIEYE